MHTLDHANETIKAVTAFVTSAVTGVGAFMGLPEFMTPEIIAATASAFTAIAGVYYLIRRLTAPAEPIVPMGG